MDNNPHALGQKTLQGSPKVLLFQDGSASYCIIVYKVLFIKILRWALFMKGTIHVLRQHVLTFFRPTHSPYQQMSAFLIPTLNMVSAFPHTHPPLTWRNTWIVPNRIRDLKSSNLQYNMLGCWNNHLFDRLMFQVFFHNFSFKILCKKRESSLQDLYTMTLIVQEKLKTPQRK